MAKYYDIDGNQVYLAEDSVRANLTRLKCHFDVDHPASWTCYKTYNNLVIAHLSDIHSDLVRYDRFLSFVEENSDLIDAAIVTGDFVHAPRAEEFAEIAEVEANHPNVNPIKVMGNHEKITYGYPEITTDQAYDYLNMDTNTGEAYFYVDFAAKGVRLICLNAYDSSDSPKASQYSQAQIDWFITTLTSAAANGLAVLIGRHNFDREFPTQNDRGFYQRFYQWRQFLNNELVCSGRPIEDIINAFKTGGSVSATYTYTDNTPTITVDASFTSAGVFVGYMCGHYHADMIGYSSNYPDQLYLSVAIGSNGATNQEQPKPADEVSDIPRDDETCQDLFNVYGIDLGNQIVKVLRVGADVNDLMEPRKTATFPFNGLS